MPLRLSGAARNAAASAIAALADAGSGPGVVEIRTGSQPASPADAATGTLLVTVPLADPAFGAVANGTAALAGTPLTATATGSGTAGWCRIKDSAGSAVMDGSVSATGGGGDLELATTSIATGLTVEITAGSMTMPAS
ncbi:hypothetical protein AB0395_33220 [Streptosporangium sp. NPDC051023]|uniref:hypothetical protein n=1 Tax=Streptosporangium sp. NPDC051023 TaxID=3155410 RepID=UPI00344FA9AD